MLLDNERSYESFVLFLIALFVGDIIKLTAMNNLLRPYFSLEGRVGSEALTFQTQNTVRPKTR